MKINHYNVILFKYQARSERQSRAPKLPLTREPKSYKYLTSILEPGSESSREGLDKLGPGTILVLKPNPQKYQNVEDNNF